MIETVIPAEGTTAISQDILKSSIARFVELAKTIEGKKSSSVSGALKKRVCILPPDFTRFHSRAGEISSILYDLMPLGSESVWSVTDVMPALGTHAPMSKDQVG